jgi:GT2 family glycosyltransferase
VETEPARDAAPGTVGVVVIGRNEGERLRRCLTSAVREVRRLLYVDSGSTDGSVALAQSLGVETLALDPRTLFSAARARNEGRERLRQLQPDLQYVQFVDGDCELCDSWLAIAAGFLDTHQDVAVVSGRLREKRPEGSLFNMLVQFEWDVPTGEVRSCGGVAMMRASAFDQAQGFRTDLIAGEEPELCVRLLSKGWRIWRLDRDMALHDLDMSRFSQWWNREVRAGHAFAEGVALHGASPARHYVRQRDSVLTWGVAIPLATVTLVAVFGSPGWWLLLLYPLQVVRLALRGTRSARENWLRGLFLVISRFPATIGVLRFYVRRALGQQPRRIDYK